MKFGICHETFQDLPLDEVFATCARLGYDSVEIAPFKLASHVTDISSLERIRIRDSATRAGIAISGIHWVLVGTEGMHLTSPDAATRARTSHYFCDLVDFCADLGGKVIIVGSPKHRSLLPGVTSEQAWIWATQLFGPSLARAAERGITICLEPLPAEDTDFINTAAEAVRFVQQFSSPHFQVILDVRAMSWEAKPIPQILRESRDHIAYIHANDKNLKGPGFGAVDYLPIAVALREIGYNGTVSVEVFNYEEGSEIIASQSLAYLRRILSHPGQ
jgi:sugar phosphate isomerase/epimerase